MSDPLVLTMKATDKASLRTQLLQLAFCIAALAVIWWPA